MNIIYYYLIYINLVSTASVLVGPSNSLGNYREKFEVRRCRASMSFKYEFPRDVERVAEDHGDGGTRYTNRIFSSN